MNTLRSCSRLSGLLFLLLWGTLEGNVAAEGMQTLTWTSPAHGTVLRLNQAYPLTATASSGLPVTFRVVSGPAEIREGDVVVTQPGRVTLVAEQAGTADWQPATSFQKFNLGRVQFERVGGLNTEQVGTSSSVQVSGQMAYLGTWNQVHAVRISDPANPELVTSVAVPSLARGIQLDASSAYVAAGSLEILDISSPGTLMSVGKLSIPAAEVEAVRLVGNLAYLACGLGGFCVADVTDRTLPRLISQTSEPRWFANSLEVKDGFAYVTSFSEPVRIFDVADPLRPRLVSSFGAKAENRLVVEDSLGYLADGWGQFQTWDLKNPGTPVWLGLVSFPYTQPFFIEPGMSMARHSGFVYIVNAGLGLQVLDASDAGNPSFVGLFGQTGQSKGLQVSGDLVHLASWGSGYEIYRQRERLPQTIQFSLPPRVSGEELPWRLTATASSGGPVSFEVLHGAAVIESGQLKSNTNGLVTILASQPGDAQFLPARAIRTIAVARSDHPLGWAVDRGFQLDTQISGIISSVVPLPDGSILAAGDPLWVAHPYYPGGEVVHLSAEGDLDSDFPSWNRGSVPNGRPVSLGKLIARTPNEVVVTEIRSQPSPPQSFFETRLYRLRSDSPEWSLLGSILNQVQPFADPLGGIILAGQMRQFLPGTLGSTTQAHLSRLGPSDEWDPRIGIPSGMAEQFAGTHALTHVHPFPDGNFVVAGSLLWPKHPGDFQANTEAFRLEADGLVRWRHTLDSPQWVRPVTFVAGVPQNRIVLFPSREVLDARTGQRVGTFPVPPEVVSATTTFFQASDGRLILSGTFTNYAGFRRHGLAAVLPDGSLDLSFDPGLGTTNGFLAIAEEADGSLLLGGEPGTFDGFAHRGLIRLIPRNPEYSAPTGAVFYLQAPQGPVYECTGPAEFVVFRTGVLTQTNRIRLQTEGGTATSEADFAPIDEELVFEPGERLKSVFLRVLSDRIVEPMESFRVRATFDSGVTVVGSTVVPIEIASFECGVNFSALSVTNREAATPLETLVWTQEYPPPGFTTRIRTRDLTALAGRDYVSQERSPLGDSGLLPLQFWDNATYEGDRSFLVEAYDPETGQSINPDRSLLVTIAEDDSLAGPGRGIAGTLNGIVPVRDGWLMLGDFSSMDGVRQPGLARVGFDGTMDPSFAPPAELAHRVVCAAGTSEGGVLLGGNFLGVGILPSGGLVQLNVHGQIDPTFEFRPAPGATECSAANDLRSLLLESDGTWLVAGYFPRFFACDSSAKLLRLSAKGQVVESWSVPAISGDNALMLLGNGHGDRYLQGGSSLFRVTEEGLLAVPATGLSTSAPVVVMPDGGLAGLRSGSPYPTLVRLNSEGVMQAETTHFEAAGDTWIGYQLHSVSVRGSDGRLLVSGIFYSATKPLDPFQTMTLALDPASLLTGQVAPAEVMNLLRLATLVSHPDGPVSGLQSSSYQQTEPKWWRLDASGQAISDVAFHNLVIDSEGQVHFALSGQAPNGYTIETSDDLLTWEPWFASNEVNWGMAFHTPPLPPELFGQFFRVR